MQQRAGAVSVFTLVVGLTASAASASSITFGSVGSFKVFTDDLGNAFDIPLGSFFRENVNVSSSIDPLPFNLKVQFGMATGIGDGSIEALEFAVTNDLDLNENGSDDVLGGIGNGTFTLADTEQQSVSTVPEPASVALFGVGLLLVANRVRRRKNERRSAQAG
jgi:hypothetical protein